VSESTFAGVSVPNDLVAGLGGAGYGPWFFPVCNRCLEGGGPCAWRHVPEIILRHWEETGHDDWDLWFFVNLPADYDLRTANPQFYAEYLCHPKRGEYLNAARCRDCFRIIRLPKDFAEPLAMAGMPDPMAVEGDSCDRCAEMLLDIARLEEDFREDEALNRKLRKRP
jgi:hypothetical protein